MRKPKPITLTLKPWPNPKPDTLYCGRIKEVKKTRSIISVTIENIDKTMGGRLHYTRLPENLHPGNKTSRFASAVGFDINTFGETIDDLHDCIGCIVAMRFVPFGDSYEIEFEKITTEAKAKTATKTGSSEASDTESVGDLDGVPDPEDDFLSM